MEIDIEALKAELESLSEEDLRKQLLDAKVRQRVATKKYYNPESARNQRLKRAEKLKQMQERAKGMPATDSKYGNLWEQIQAEATAEADRQLAEEEAEQEVSA